MDLYRLQSAQLFASFAAQLSSISAAHGWMRLESYALHALTTGERGTPPIPRCGLGRPRRLRHSGGAVVDEASHECKRPRAPCSRPPRSERVPNRRSATTPLSV